MTPSLIQQIEAIPGVDLVIEDLTKVVDFQGMETRTGVTVRCTKPGDPLLKFYHADCLLPGQKAVVINQALADATGIKYQSLEPRHLQVAPNQMLKMSVTRQEQSGPIQVQVTLHVAQVVSLGGKSPNAYLHRNFLDQIEHYQMGRRVDALGWPGYRRSASVSYTDYLVFSKEALSASDQLKLKANGMTAVLLSAQKDEDEELRTLAGCLKPHVLFVHRLTTAGASGAKRFTRPPEEIESITDVDDVVVGWSPPFHVDQVDTKLIGLTLRKRWLKGHFVRPDIVFANDKDEFRVLPLDPGIGKSDLWEMRIGPQIATLAVQTPGTLATPSPSVTPAPAPFAGTFQSLRNDLQSLFGGANPTAPTGLTPDPASPVTVATLKPVAPAPIRAVVPAAFLAHLHAQQRGEVEFDATAKLFVDAARENTYYQGRVVAESIHAVPAVDSHLVNLGFATQSQRTRVEELQGYTRTLILLVTVVGGVSAFFGFWCLIAAFWQETSRKLRFLAQMRAMGTSRFTIALVVVLRGLFIGAIASAVSIGLAILISQRLTLHLAECVITTEHLKWMAWAAISASTIGSLLPAIRASLVQPADAIRNGVSA